MSIHFHWKSCALTQKRERGGESAPSRVAALSAKAAALLERAKLMSAIADLKDEIALQMCAIGELVYATHKGTPSDSDELQKILTFVDDLYDEIEAHEQELLLLDDPAVCPICGALLAQDAVYCEVCGQPMPSEKF